MNEHDLQNFRFSIFEICLLIEQCFYKISASLNYHCIKHGDLFTWDHTAHVESCLSHIDAVRKLGINPLGMLMCFFDNCY